MKKIFIIIILLFFTFSSCAGNSVKHTIEGVWSSHPEARVLSEGEGFSTHDLSWGRRSFPRAINFIIDLHSEPPSIEIAEFSWDEIICVNEEGNKTELTFFFTRGGFNVTMICHFNEDGTMWIEPIVGLTFFGTGRDFIYRKIDGP